MDQLIVDLGIAEDEPGAPNTQSGRTLTRVGDITTLFSDPDRGTPNAGEQTQATGTINYGVATHLGERVPHVHLSAVE